MASALRLWTHKQTWVILLVFTSLFALLFQYRFLSLLKRLGADVTPIGTRFPLVLDFQNAPQWLLPFLYTMDYLNTVWFTTLLGLFIAGAAVAFLPRLIHKTMVGNGLRQILTGVLFGLPNMLCTCCAVSPLAGLRRAGAGLGAVLAFFVTAPALNVVVIVLAIELLPLRLALARIFLGLVAAIGITYVLTKLFPESTGQIANPSGVDGEESVREMLHRWMIHTWEVAKTAVPMLLIGLVMIGILKTVLSFETIARNLGNGWVPTVLASTVGTLLMVPTFTEVLWVKEFSEQGIGMGPAVALLITLPAVSLPSLLVVGRVFKSYKLAASLGILVWALGIVSGVLLSV